MTAKQQAMIDMSSEGISIVFFSFEKAILEFTATEDSIKVDFRKFNRGYHPKKDNNKNTK